MKFENHYNEIYPSVLTLKNKNTSPGETTFLDLIFILTRTKLKQLYIIKRSPAISGLRYFYIKVALYHQKYFSQQLAQKYFKYVD